MKSKTSAERAAWDFIAREGRDLELSVINPVVVFGPVLGPDYSTSVLLIRRLMSGVVPGSPRLNFGVVDVRDVADLHIRAMTHAAAKGERFLPNWLVRIAALRDPAVKQILPELGKLKNGTNEKARRLLGWLPRSNEEAIIACAESLLDLGLLKKSA